MFRHFSFEAAASRHLPAGQRDEPAPTSKVALRPARLPTPPPCSVDSLTHALDKQNLRVDVCSSYQPSYEPLTPPSDELAFSEISDRQPSLSSIRLASATLRMQRQANMRMQCTTEHVKDISLLVKKMVEAEDQCHMCEPKSLPPPSPPMSDDDEGVDMEYTPTEVHDELRFKLLFWRAGERDIGCARVCKSVRMRKKPRVVKRLPK